MNERVRAQQEYSLQSAYSVNPEYTWSLYGRLPTQAKEDFAVFSAKTRVCVLVDMLTSSSKDY
jgi:hypothetical protein